VSSLRRRLCGNPRHCHTQLRVRHIAPWRGLHHAAQLHYTRRLLPPRALGRTPAIPRAAHWCYYPPWFWRDGAWPREYAGSIPGLSHAGSIPGLRSIPGDQHTWLESRSRIRGDAVHFSIPTAERAVDCVVYLCVVCAPTFIIVRAGRRAVGTSCARVHNLLQLDSCCIRPALLRWVPLHVALPRAIQTSPRTVSSWRRCRTQTAAAAARLCRHGPFWPRGPCRDAALATCVAATTHVARD